MSAAGSGVRRAAVLGTVTGARTFLAPAALALRGRLGKVAKYTLPVLAAGELVGDKLPSAPPRIEGPGLVGRVVSGAFAGRVSGGNPGLRAGAAFALASAYPSQVLRQQTVKRTPLPDIACAVPEDLVGIALVTAASGEPREPVTEEESTPGVLGTAWRGLAAAAVGTAAMTTAQQWVYGFTGGVGSEAPARFLLQGAGWGLPFGLVATRGGRTPRPGDGLALALGAWAVSLAELPALGVAPLPWKRSPAALAQDLGFHLVYGAATAAALEAFTA